MNIILYLFMFFCVIIGGGSTLALIIMLLGTIGYKIYRKIRFGISLYD
ncbi:MAG: hypothetical protein J5988_11445 [Eubacterium sp.]|nr:hypothetical protein [Eubacterium sp.]